MLNKYLHLISMKERAEAVGLRKGLGKHLLLIISCSQFPSLEGDAIFSCSALRGLSL